MKTLRIIITLLFLGIAVHSATPINPLPINTDRGEISEDSSSETSINFDTLFVTWTGSSNDQWTNPANWSGNRVPAEEDDVIIPAGSAYSPIISNGTIGWCNSIRVNSGATFTLSPFGVLNIKSGSLIPGASTLITAEATLITSVSAQLGGTITALGDCPITAHGIVISTYNNPTTRQTTYADISLTGTGTFSINVGSLMPNTTYYARAYATNCKGTNYGNEIKFKTTGGGLVDTGYFRLTTGGFTYFSYDLLDPIKASTVFPEGDTRFAFVSVDPETQVFSLASQSSYLLNTAASFGYNFSYINPDVNGVGTYTFGKYNATYDKDILIAIRSGPGVSVPVLSPNFNEYQNLGNFSRHLVDNECIVSETTSALNTLIITRWGNPGEYIEGTITGTLYEFPNTDHNCVNSTTKPFIVEFKLKRLQ